jgi:hypothetical protein
MSSSTTPNHGSSLDRTERLNTDSEKSLRQKALRELAQSGEISEGTFHQIRNLMKRRGFHGLKDIISEEALTDGENGEWIAESPSRAQVSAPPDGGYIVESLDKNEDLADK